ncbi:MAG: Sir2 silent information regulator family NAD-dependent deacetylase [Muribaculaceae bacterium]|nr:Sir2 silent information regulator family NAD-dependent deacetylase [Muribaculaceae bacterium]
MLKKIQPKHKQMTFEQFLNGTPARDYIFQETPYEEQIRQAAEMIKDADYVLMGAGAGMSAAAGARYGGQFFKEHFGEFIEKYGSSYRQDMYSAGFYPYPDEESKWGYWSKHALLAGVDLDVTPLHRKLLKALEGKNSFLLSTNVDDQFLRAGYPAERIFATQGSYSRIQCKKGCHPKTYDGTGLFRQMDQARKDCKVPSYMVPKCPVCGGFMEMNLRSDNNFVQDEAWYAAEKRFGDFLSECMDKKTALLELGVGFNTPTIIRFPFERLVREHKNICLIRLNLNEAVIPESFGNRAVGINADMAQSIQDIVQGVLPGQHICDE